ncbi:MAG TPA: LCP family protein, partial [Thermoleophilia bacterium]|nr:LCP family protein [Thermoleophilia bacterium]
MAEYTRYTATLQPRRKRRLWVSILWWVGVVLVVAVSLGAGMAFGWLSRTVAEVETKNPQTVTAARQELTETLPGEPVTVLLIGSDRREVLGEADVGRSDTLIVVRLDPRTKRISMLSIPRDLRVEIPGYGLDRINAAYSLGGGENGPAFALKTVKQLTGLQINDFIDVNFRGFIRVVDKIGGAFVMVDRRYYNDTAVTNYASIDLQPGYQRLDGRDALSFVRFRHDGAGDFGRIVRQQMFLREFKRQIGESAKWQNWRRLPGLIRIVTGNTISDISSFGKLLSLGRLVMGLDTNNVYQTHIEAVGIMVPTADGTMASQLQASPEEVQAAVQRFLHPETAPPAPAQRLPLDAFAVRVMNGSGAPNIAGQVAGQLSELGYRTTVAGNAPTFYYAETVVYSSPGLVPQAERVARLMRGAAVKVVPRGPGAYGGLTVIVGAGFSGALAPPPETSATPAPTLVHHTRPHLEEWKALATQARLKLRMPTTWPEGYGFDQFRAYTTPTGEGRRARAAVVVATTPDGGYFDIQALRWASPPAIADPDQRQAIDG